MKHEAFRSALDSLLPSEERKRKTLERILKRSSETPPEREREKMKPLNLKHSLRLTVAAALAALLLLGAGVYAGYRSFSWSRGYSFTVDRTAGGLYIQSGLDTDALTEPVELRDGRLFFIVKGENLDITDRVSETEAFVYEYTDHAGVVHRFGKNGPAPEDYGYAEFMSEPDGDYVSGYSVRAGNGGGEAPAWYRNGAKDFLP